MTSNEASILGAIVAAVISAIVSAIVAWRVVVYTTSHGPDYQKQLNDLGAEMGRVSSAQEGLLAHQRELAAEARDRREARSWRPDEVSLESNKEQRRNTMWIISERNFYLLRVSLRTEYGVTVAVIPTESPDEECGSAQIEIPQESLMALVTPDPDYARYSKSLGKLVYELGIGDERWIVSLELPFRAIRDVSNNVEWVRMEG